MAQTGLNSDSSARPPALLQQAVENYRRQYGPIGGLSSYQLSLHELLQDVARLEQDAKKHPPVKKTGARSITSRLQGLIAFVDRYTPAIDCLAQSCSGSLVNPATLVWGLLRIVLEVASSATRYLPSLLGLLDEVSTAVSLYSLYEEILFQHPRFQHAVVEVYTDIIGILDKARRILTQSKWRLLLRSFKMKFETDFKDNLDSVKRHLTALENETTLAHRREMHWFAAESRAGLLAHNAGNGASDDIEQQIYQWLAPLDCDARWAEISRVRHAGSCSWLLDHKQYLEWKTDYDKPRLWVSGPPGIGKTVLSSAVIADLRATCAAPACIAMFYCDANDGRSRSMDVLLATIIAQMAASVPTDHRVDGTLPSCLTSAYRKSVRFGRASLSQADSPQDLIAEMALLVKNTWVVIDGLDELDQPERAQELVDIASRVGPVFRLTMLSRRTPELHKVFVHTPQIQVQAPDIRNDIEQFVEAKSRELPLDQDDDAARQGVVQAVNAKAEGMFLWASLVMKDLSTATCLADIEEILGQYPVGLSGVYDRFLLGLAAQSTYRQRLARDLLWWSCCAFRPLKIRDLASAVSTGKDALGDGRLDAGHDLVRASRLVMLDICCPFLVFNNTLDTLRPVHHSFREYLVGPTPSRMFTTEAVKFFIQPATTHGDLALRCIRYLKSRPFLSSGMASDTCSDDFWNYAMTFWCQHAVKASHNEKLESGIHDLISTAAKRQHWLGWMLFGHHGSPFSLASIFRLQKNLRDWAKPSTKEGSDSLKTLTGKEWNMDCLELLIKATRRRGGLTGQLSATYFGTMMVARGLVRKLNRDAQICEAIQRLEEFRVELEQQARVLQVSAGWGLGFVHNILGLLHDQEGHVGPALRAHQMARSVQEDLSKGDDKSNEDVLWSINEMGRMYRHMGLLEESESMHRHVLGHLAANLAEDHPELVWTINTLATTLRKQNRAGEALGLHMRAYNSRSQSLGELHAHSLWSCGDVAKCFQDQGLFGPALTWYQKALDGRVETLGPEHPDTLWSMNHIGVVLAELGRYFEAAEIQKRALGAQERILGQYHEHTCWTRNAVADFKQDIRIPVALCIP